MTIEQLAQLRKDNDYLREENTRLMKDVARYRKEDDERHLIECINNRRIDNTNSLDKIAAEVYNSAFVQQAVDSMALNQAAPDHFANRLSINPQAEPGSMIEVEGLTRTQALKDKQEAERRRGKIYEDRRAVEQRARDHETQAVLQEAGSMLRFQAVPRYSEPWADAPDSNPKTSLGLLKPPMHLIPMAAQVHMAQAFRDGAAKYGPYNWRHKPVSVSVYVAAAWRHIGQFFDGEDYDPISQVHHLGHAMACLAIILDWYGINDDRPPKGDGSKLIERFTQKVSK